MEQNSKLLQWPNGSSFALFLSHDVDQIHDREMWRILADLNHMRRVAFSGEPGDIWLAMRRIGRALVQPKPAVQDFETILNIESRYGFRSTFFILHDHYWARHGARFHWWDPELRSIVALVQNAGCEIGVHGGYYRFNKQDGYRDSINVFSDAFGVEVDGIRNHMLRHIGRDTWLAQVKAGFSYDATCGYGRFGGPGDVSTEPFWAIEPSSSSGRGLVELPLTLMDCRLFRDARLSGAAALDAAWCAIEPVIANRGLVTLLWHNNYFNEPEYRDWQWVYEQLLEQIARLNPWCATGAEIANWWRRQVGNSCAPVDSNNLGLHSDVPM